MLPIVKIYKVPVEISGVSSPTPSGTNPVLGCPALDAPENPDIRWFTDEPMTAIVQGKDELNHAGDPGETGHEPEHKWKVKLSPTVDPTIFCVQGLPAAGRKWVTTINHPDYIPEIYLRQAHNYFGQYGTVWAYTHVPRYNAKRQPYYQFVEQVGGATLLQFTEEFMADCRAGKIVTATDGMTPVAGEPASFGVYATFWFWDPECSVIWSQPEHTFAPAKGDYCAMSEVAIYEDGYAVYSRADKSLGSFDPDPGVFTWRGGAVGKPKFTISGYRHTWVRLWSSDQADLSFQPGEDYYQLGENDFRVSANTELVKALTTQHPWYLYADIKVINESLDTPLEKFCVYPVLRGNTDSKGNLLNGFSGALDMQRPWDAQRGAAMETVGYGGVLQSGAGNTICSVMALEAGNATQAYPNFCQPGAFRSIFPQPCKDTQDRGIQQVIRWFESTRPDSTPTLCFVRNADDLIDETGLIVQNPSSASRMVLPPGVIASAGPTGALEPLPQPGAIFCRVAWTYRVLGYDGRFTNSFRTDVAEAVGEKVFSLRVTGSY